MYVKNLKCLNQTCYHGSISLSKSGTTVTKATYIKPPEVNGNIQAVLLPGEMEKKNIHLKLL